MSSPPSLVESGKSTLPSSTGVRYPSIVGPLTQSGPFKCTLISNDENRIYVIDEQVISSIVREHLLELIQSSVGVSPSLSAFLDPFCAGCAAICGEVEDRVRMVGIRLD